MTLPAHHTDFTGNAGVSQRTLYSQTERLAWLSMPGFCGLWFLASFPLLDLGMAPRSDSPRGAHGQKCSGSRPRHFRRLRHWRQATLGVVCLAAPELRALRDPLPPGLVTFSLSQIAWSIGKQPPVGKCCLGAERCSAALIQSLRQMGLSLLSIHTIQLYITSPEARRCLVSFFHLVGL